MELQEQYSELRGQVGTIELVHVF